MDGKDEEVVEEVEMVVEEEEVVVEEREEVEVRVSWN